MDAMLGRPGPVRDTGIRKKRARFQNFDFDSTLIPPICESPCCSDGSSPLTLASRCRWDGDGGRSRATKQKRGAEGKEEGGEEAQRRPEWEWVRVVNGGRVVNRRESHTEVKRRWDPGRHLHGGENKKVGGQRADGKREESSKLRNQHSTNSSAPFLPWSRTRINYRGPTSSGWSGTGNRW